jgi:hypothetical protein
VRTPTDQVPTIDKLPRRYIWIPLSFRMFVAILLVVTAVTDNGLAFLSDLVRIEHLSLAGTRITDAGLSHLAGLTKLQELNLAETRVSDVGLKYLHSMSQLQRVCLDETNVTDAGVAELGRTLPHLHIERRTDQD